MLHCSSAHLLHRTPQRTDRPTDVSTAARRNGQLSWGTVEPRLGPSQCLLPHSVGYMFHVDATIYIDVPQKQRSIVLPPETNSVERSGIQISVEVKGSEGQAEATKKEKKRKQQRGFTRTSSLGCLGWTEAKDDGRAANRRQQLTASSADARSAPGAPYSLSISAHRAYARAVNASHTGGETHGTVLPLYSPGGSRDIKEIGQNKSR
ncbi:hypothetical protein BC826DRAFT_972413 [Russula brevipes]|nr:hypothetical protein BC826DRAFT_972413 [Russula brevipes]